MGRVPVSKPSRRTVLRGGILAATVVVAWVVLRDLPWQSMAAAVRGVSPLQLAVLLVLVGARAVVAAAPASFLMPEISWLRATRNDLAGALVQNFAPPPSDVGLRFAMLKSWRVDGADGMASLVLAGLIFYAGRCVAPAAGFAVVLLSGRIDRDYLTVAVVAAVVAVVLGAAVLIVPRSPSLAAGVARFAAAVVGRVRDVDAQAWQQTSTAFSQRARGRLERGWIAAVAAVAALLVIESLIFVLCLRVVGVGPDDLVTDEIVGAFLVGYPLTMLPFSGIVLLDAVLLTALLRQSAGALEAQIAAGLMLWRIATLLIPFVLGLAVLLHWQRNEGRGVVWRGSTGGPA